MAWIEEYYNPGWNKDVPEFQKWGNDALLEGNSMQFGNGGSRNFDEESLLLSLKDWNRLGFPVVTGDDNADGRITSLEYHTDKDIILFYDETEGIIRNEFPLLNKDFTGNFTEDTDDIFSLEKNSKYELSFLFYMERPPDYMYVHLFKDISTRIDEEEYNLSSYTYYKWYRFSYQFNVDFDLLTEDADDYKIKIGFYNSTDSGDTQRLFLADLILKEITI